MLEAFKIDGVGEINDVKRAIKYIYFSVSFVIFWQDRSPILLRSRLEQAKLLKTRYFEFNLHFTSCIVY